MMRGLLRFVVFPFGVREKAPGDRLTHRVAQLLLVPSDTRDRLTNGVYKSAAAGHPVGLMEEALPKVIRAEPLERRVMKAVKKGVVSGISWEEQLKSAFENKILSAEELEILLDVHELVTEIIAVDDFDSEELRLGRRETAPLDTQHAA
jgi:acyl-CoA dehydrogenase